MENPSFIKKRTMQIYVSNEGELLLSYSSMWNFINEKIKELNEIVHELQPGHAEFGYALLNNIRNTLSSVKEGYELSKH